MLAANADLRALCEEVTTALRAALPYFESAAQEESMYGFFPGGDPRQFTPDQECSTPAEIEAWKIDCAAAEAGHLEQTPDCQWIVQGELPAELHAALRKRAEERGDEYDENGPGLVHVLRSHYGPGTYTLQDPHAVAALASVRAGLAAAPLLAGECERLLGRVAEAEAAIWGLLCALGNASALMGSMLLPCPKCGDGIRDGGLVAKREDGTLEHYVCPQELCDELARETLAAEERAEKAEAEAARLRQEADEARESMEYAYQGKQRAREKTERAEEAARRLADAIGDAPHTSSCGYTIGRACDCWKSRALVPAGAERSET